MEKETLTKIRKAGALREHKNNIYIIQEKNSTENIQKSVYIILWAAVEILKKKKGTLFIKIKVFFSLCFSRKKLE